MAKTRHREFEIFEFLQEASDALASKSARENRFSLDPDLWRFHLLDVSIRPSGVVHLTFKQQPAEGAANPMSELGKDLNDLKGLLANGSRVLLDFEGVLEFDAAAIAKLTELKGKLQNRGSRIVLCNLGPTVVPSFFPRIGGKTDAKS